MSKEFDFRFDTKEEIDKIEKSLHYYLANECPQISLPERESLNLLNAFNKLKDVPHGRKTLAALVDLKLNILFLYKEMLKIAELDQKRQFEFIPDSNDLFCIKMEIVRYQFSLIVRYRAIWDKILGVFILYYLPEKYENFAKAKSRKQAFIKIAKSNTSPSFLMEVERIITEFDNEFRTAEVHGPGRIRKWLFGENSIWMTPFAKFVELIAIHLSNMVSLLNSVFSESSFYNPRICKK